MSAEKFRYVFEPFPGHPGKVLAIKEDGGHFLKARRDLVPCQGSAFEWGDTGPQARLLAVSLLAEVANNDLLAELYSNDFTLEVISYLRGENWTLRAADVCAWIVEKCSAELLGGERGDLAAVLARLRNEPNRRFEAGKSPS